MDKEIEKELKRYYTKHLQIEVENINRQKYIIRIKIALEKNSKIGSNFYYKWDNTATTEANIREIKYKTEKHIVNLFKVNGGMEF